MKFNLKIISGFLIVTSTIILTACTGEGSDQDTNGQTDSNLEKIPRFIRFIISLPISLLVAIVIFSKLLNILFKIMKYFLQSHITNH